LHRLDAFHPARPVLIAVLVLLAIVSSAVAQQTIHIPADQPTIQAGINAASNGDTVLVAPGTYYENIDFKGKAITVTSSAGAAATIIDGSGTAGMPVVAFKTHELRNSILSDFTIQHGGTQTFSSQASGGIFVHSAAPTIANNIVTANQCSGLYAFGGALIQGNTVMATQYDNWDSHYSYCQQTGTAIVIEGTTTVAGYTHVEVIGNTIQNNTRALGVGGIGIYAAEGTLIQGNIISNNSSSYVGGIETSNTQEVLVIDNLIYGNSAGIGNGAGHAGGMQISAPFAIITGNTFTGNSLASGAVGESATELNLSSPVSQYLLSNNIIAGASSTFAALNCSVNYAGSSPTPAFDHNDVYNPAGSAYGGACLSQTGNLGNISADPLFVAPGANFHIVSSSPVIDSGNNSAPATPATDLDGNPRIQDATQIGHPVIDMGPYEYLGFRNGSSFATVLVSSLNPCGYSQSVTFTASVTNSSSTPATPTGTINFTDGANLLGVQPLKPTNSTTASASFTTSTLNAGNHSITATYSPATGSPSSASIAQNVTGTPTSTSLTSSLNPASYGAAIAFTATVTSSSSISGVPSGTVTLMDGAAVLATQQLTPSGATASGATFSIAALSAGSHILSAVYVSTGPFVPSSATLAETISGISPTTITLTGSPNPVIIGNSVTFISTVTSTAAIGGPPTGAVTLTLGGTTLLGSQRLVAISNTTAQISLPVSNLPLGGQAIQATYNPTGNFLPSTAAITEVILPAPDLTITLANPSITIRTQHHTTTTLTLASVNGFADSLTISCANLPQYLTCRPTPGTASLSANGSATVSLYLDTDSVLGYARNTGTSFPSRVPPIMWAFLVAPLTLLGCTRSRRHGKPGVRLLMFALAVLPLSLALAGCGQLIISAEIPPSVAPGTYIIPITATGAASGVSHTAQLTLQVTP
jgi:hypothetical protein